MFTQIFNKSSDSKKLGNKKEESGPGKELCVSYSQNSVKGLGSPLPPGSYVYAFVDYSNISIMTQTVSSNDMGFPEKIYDPCLKLDIPKLYKFAKNHAEEKYTRPLQHFEMFIYTSDPGLLIHDAIKGTNIIPRVFNKGFHNREKRVDTHLVADAIEVCCSQSDSHENVKKVLSVWSGDADVLNPIIEKSSKYGWNVDVWSFKESLSSGVRTEYPETVERTTELNDVYREFSERKFGYQKKGNKELPYNSIFRLTFEPNGDDTKYMRNNWRLITKTLTTELRLPLQGWLQENELAMVVAVPPQNSLEHLAKVWSQRNNLEMLLRLFFNQQDIKTSCKLKFDDRLVKQIQTFQSNKKKSNTTPASNDKKGDSNAKPNEDKKGQGSKEGNKQKQTNYSPGKNSGKPLAANMNSPTTKSNNEVAGNFQQLPNPNFQPPGGMPMGGINMGNFPYMVAMPPQTMIGQLTPFQMHPQGQGQMSGNPNQGKPNNFRPNKLNPSSKNFRQYKSNDALKFNQGQGKKCNEDSK